MIRTSLNLTNLPIGKPRASGDDPTLAEQAVAAST